MTPERLPRSITERFREVARHLPDTPALVSPGISLTFAEADRRADRIAAGLIGRLGSDAEPIATLLPHGASGLLGLLAAMRTGRPVVGLDQLVPAARLASIMEHAGCVGLLTDTTDDALAEVVRELREVRPDLGTVIEMTDAASGAAGVLSGPLGEGITDTACIVFTSGSTGAPKGVVWTHGTLINDAYAGAERLGFAPGDRVALVLPYSFAAGLTVVVFGMLNGAGVYAYDPRALGLRDLPAWIESQRLTTLHTTPSLLRSITASLAAGQRLGQHLRLLTTCGEAIHGRNIAAIRPHLPGDCHYVNWSGASEVASLAFYPIPPGVVVPEGPVPAGRPAAGKQVVVLGEDGTQLPAGETGDVVVTSAYLAAGYWRAPEATATRYTELADGTSSCRTGDLGRFEPDGNLVLLGRRDSAVKIRGYLVEPSEVEAALLASPAIADAVVAAVRIPAAAGASGQANPATAHPAGEGPSTATLVAYIVPAATDSTPSAVAVRRMLREKLPAWMVPATIVTLPELPRNERGKVDRAALPVPVRRTTPSARPRNQWEIVVADLWCRILNLEEIGLDDDFMELGGDSLAANEMITLVSKRLGVDLPSSALVDAPVLRDFAHKVSLAQRSGPMHPTVVPLRTTGSRPPLFCVAGAGGLALGFLSLARRLSKDQPVYAFQAHGLERRGLPDWTVERTARRHLEIIRVLCPRGPYLLAGHSLGGLIAMEIGHQLAAAGEKVELLTLLDTYLPLSEKPKTDRPSSTERPRPKVGRTTTVANANRSSAGSGGDDGVGGRGSSGHGASSRREPFRGNDVTRNYAARLAQFRRILPERVTSRDTLRKLVQLPFAGLVRYQGLTQFDVFFNHGRLLERFYRLRPWPGRTLVYRANDNPDAEEDWAVFLTGPRRTRDIPCEHFSILREPHVVGIAADIDAEVDRIMAESPVAGSAAD